MCSYDETEMGNSVKWRDEGRSIKSQISQLVRISRNVIMHIHHPETPENDFIHEDKCCTAVTGTSTCCGPADTLYVVIGWPDFTLGCEYVIVSLVLRLVRLCEVREDQVGNG